ncbi:MAG: CocE/NonD family hydrolase [Acidimicrobiia bacterium]
MSRAVSWLAEKALRLPPATSRRVEVDEDVRIPVAEGVVLLADVHTPVDHPPAGTVLVRSPYGRKGLQGILNGRILAERGLRVVLQSCRGTFGSEGTFAPERDERADGLATIRWIEAQPWFDGRLAMFGASYVGYAQWAVAAEAGSSLQALCPSITMSDLAGYLYRSGSFALDDALTWTSLVVRQERTRFPLLDQVLPGHRRRIDRAMGHVPVDEIDVELLGEAIPFWKELVADEAERERIRLGHGARAHDVAEVTVPVSMVAGWFDIFLPAQLADYRRAVEAGNRPRLTIGAWTHLHPRVHLHAAVDAVDWIGRAVRERPDPGPVRIQVMGPGGGWREVPSWPPPGYATQRWHLQPGGGLTPEPPVEGPDGPAQPSRFSYHPADPTPSVGGPLLSWRAGRRDQRALEARSDVLCFTGAPLERDLEVVGELAAEVHVACDLDHFDVCVRLCEVDERGRSRNVADGLARISPAVAPRPADGVWTVAVEMWPTAHRFARGRRLRLQVAAGAHPRYARNLGTDEPFGQGTTMRRARLEVHHSAARPSALLLPVPDGEPRR